MLTRPKKPMSGFVRDALEAESVMGAYDARLAHQKKERL